MSLRLGFQRASRAAHNFGRRKMSGDINDPAHVGMFAKHLAR
jgi:hypothetical protein